MTIRTIVNFEQEVTHHLIKLFRCSEANAQTIAEENKEFISNCFVRKDTAKDTAEIIFKSWKIGNLKKNFRRRKKKLTS